MTPASLSAALLDAVRTQGFEHTEDSTRGGAAIERFPSIDLAVVAFPPNKPPVAANVLFSREHPAGVIATIGPDFGPPGNIRFVADLTNAKRESIAWRADSDWSAMPWQPLAGMGEHRFVAPYPASLIKLMVLIGVARCIDGGRIDWECEWHYMNRTRSIAAWAEDMMVVSSNEATSALVAVLHHAEMIVCDDTGETRNELNATFARYGFATLRLSDTKADGGWTNPAGAGVGHLQMTAWDTARLLWLLDENAPVAPWLPIGTEPIVTQPTRVRIRAILEAQALNEVLASTLLSGVPGWIPGIPAKLADRWISPDGSVTTHGETYPADVRPANRAATVRFAHKTGTTENYLSDAGIVVGLPPAQRHYLIALISNLGSRYAPRTPADCCATTWRVPALGAAIDKFLASELEPS